MREKIRANIQKLWVDVSLMLYCFSMLSTVSQPKHSCVNGARVQFNMCPVGVAWAQLLLCSFIMLLTGNLRKKSFFFFFITYLHFRVHISIE